MFLCCAGSFISAHADGTVTMWEAGGTKILEEYVGADCEPIYDIKVMPEGGEIESRAKLVTAGADGIVRFYNV